MLTIPKKPRFDRSEQMEAIKAKKKEDSVKAAAEAMCSDSDNEEGESDDDSDIDRIHCWVLIKQGSRNVLLLWDFCFVFPRIVMKEILERQRVLVKSFRID